MTDIPQCSSKRAGGRVGLFRGLAYAALAGSLLASAVWAGRVARRGSVAGSSPTETLPAGVSDAEAARDPAHGRGKLVYTVYCGKCHGEQGHGDGEGVLHLPSHPRDFAADQWRFPKTRESIARVVREGIPGTSMPASGQALSTDDIGAVTEYVLELSRRANRAEPNTMTDAVSLALEKCGFRRVAPGGPVLDASFVSTAGEAASLAGLRGRPVLLHFWGTTCVHCLAELPRLITLTDAIPESQFTIVSVCADESDPAITEETGRPHAGEHPLYVDETGLAVHRFQAQVLPTYVLIGSHGRVIGRREGKLEISAEGLSELLKALQNK